MILGQARKPLPDNFIALKNQNHSPLSWVGAAQSSLVHEQH